MTSFRTVALAAAAVSLLAAPVAGQSFHLGLRGGAGIPTGAFADEQSSSGANDALVAGAKTGFGYGLDAGVGLGVFGIYAGFDKINFDCETSACTSEGKYKLAGVSAGVRLTPPGLAFARPWVKAGVTFNELEGGYGGGAASRGLTTDRTPGYEIGAGLDIPVFGAFALTPQVRYVGQNLKYKVPGVTAPATDDEVGVNYFTADLGFSLTNPFRSAKRR